MSPFFLFVCKTFHWHVFEIPGSLVWRCWVIQTGLQESESGCKSVLSGGLVLGLTLVLVAVLMVIAFVGRVVLFLPCEVMSFPPFHSLLCHRLQTPGYILKTLRLRCKDMVSHPVLKALVDLLNFLHLVRNQDQVVSPEKLCTVFFNLISTQTWKNIRMNKFVDKCGETCWWHCDEFLFLIVFSTAVERSEKVPEVATAICRLWRQLVTFFDDIVIPCKVAMVVIVEIVPLILCQSVKGPRSPPLHLLSTSMNIEQNCNKAQFESSRLSSHLYQVGILSQYLTFEHALRPPGGQSLNWSDNNQQTWQLIFVIFPFWLLLSWQTLKMWSWILTELFLNISFLTVKRWSKG